MSTPPSGRYQIVVRELRLVGLGELLMQLEELKKKLHARGWFDAARKQNIPRFPTRIGIVTSPTGAAIQDILNVLQRRFSGFSLLLNPVRVQGQGAATEIAQAIRDFNQYRLVDVIIIGRGGGSIEDLWAFNEEIVAEAIFHSQIPIISAVGHETDVCLSDYVADARAPTPSAAAAMVIAEKEQQVDFLAQMQRRVLLALRTRLSTERQKMAHMMKQPAFASSYGIMGLWMQRADDLRSQIDLEMKRKLQHFAFRLQSARDRLMALQPSARIQHIRARVDEWERTLTSILRNLISGKKAGLCQLEEKHLFIWQSQQSMRRQLFVMPYMYKQLDMAWNRNFQLYRERSVNLGAGLQALHPKRLLGKGYAILFDQKTGTTIGSVSKISEYQRVNVQLADGEFATTLREVVFQGMGDQNAHPSPGQKESKK